MRVTVNGRERELGEGATVTRLMAEFGLDPARTVAEVNRAIVPRDAYDATALNAGDVVELVELVGGG